MNKVETFLSQELIQALGWTILHSLWQAALVALALSALLILLNRHSAQVRYFVSVTAMFTTLALAVFTFFSLYSHPEVAPAQTAITSFSGLNPTVLAAPEVQPESWFDKLPFSGFFETYFEKHLPLIVTFWFMGLLVMALKMLGSLAYVQRLKNYQTKALGLKWQNKLSELQEKLDFKKPVKLMESMRVKVPVAIGYLKPVILMPIGAVSGLSEKQVEAILAHELAHIYRNDYLFNLVQTLVETVFFYHPAMWWIGSNIRAERENCCDDIALNLCGDSLVFAGALAELEEMTYAPSPALAMAYNGKRGSLLGRIKRMVNGPRRRASFSEGFIAACFLMVSISAISLNAMAQLTPDFEEFPYYIGSISANKPEVKETKPAPDTELLAIKVPGNEICKPCPISLVASVAPVAKISDYLTDDYTLSVSAAPDDDGKDIIIVKNKKGRIVEMFVDGKKVRKKDLPEMEKIIEGRASKKKKKKEYASKEDLREARETLAAARQTAPRPRVYVYNNAAPEARAYYRYSVSTPPAPPVLGVEPPTIAPMRPMRPMRPLRPMKPIAPHAGDSEEDMKEWEKEMKEWEKELKEWESNSGKEWDEYEKDMAEFSKEMEEYSKEMAEYGRELSKNIHAQMPRIYTEVDGEGKGHRIVVEDREREIAIERSAEARERAAKDRERAAKERERAAKDREKAAVERAKANELRAKERAKAAEERAKEAKERNERMEKLKAELVKDKLIGEKDKALSYKISKEGLFVNGKKQPQATFEKYKKMFHPNMKDGANYNEVYNITAD